MLLLVVLIIAALAVVVLFLQEQIADKPATRTEETTESASQDASLITAA
jgi:regulatory protein YycI of two-component signal transduction system YycFG